ncbi:hypothetical protein UlMin_030012 [Ulmus minor]
MASASKMNPSDSEDCEEIIISYKECRRNHALLSGSHVVDGCREFAPKGAYGTEKAFLCEACKCHRSFHRKEIIKNGVVQSAPPTLLDQVTGQLPFKPGPIVSCLMINPTDYYHLLPQQSPPPNSESEVDHVSENYVGVTAEPSQVEEPTPTEKLPAPTAKPNPIVKPLPIVRPIAIRPKRES